MMVTRRWRPSDAWNVGFNRNLGCHWERHSARRNWHRNWVWFRRRRLLDVCKLMFRDALERPVKMGRGEGAVGLRQNMRGMTGKMGR
jgi:hypothetical protein